MSKHDAVVRRALALFFGIVALFVGCDTAAIATGSPAAVAKTCSAAYTHAVIGGSEKCLRAGEFCTHTYDFQYRRYRFRCIRYYANVSRYRLTHA